MLNQACLKTHKKQTNFIKNKNNLIIAKYSIVTRIRIG